MISEIHPHVFAREWATAWSCGDLDVILSHYADDVTFRSPRAEKVAGTARIEDRLELQTYWARALKDLGPVTFEVIDVAWDERCSHLTVRYRSRRGSRAVRAVELFEFDEAGRVSSGEAFYGMVEEHTGE